MIRSHDVGLTFIEPSDRIRHLVVKLKHTANRAKLIGKRIVFLGESHHWVHEKYTCRELLLRYLVSRGWRHIARPVAAMLTSVSICAASVACLTDAT